MSDMGAHVLRLVGGDLRLMSVESAQGHEECRLAARLLVFSPDSMELRGRYGACVDAGAGWLSDPRLHEVGENVWVLLGSRSRSLNAWRIALAGQNLQVQHVAENRDWSYLAHVSVADAETGAVFVMQRRGQGRSVPILRIAADGAFTEQTLEISCGGERRYDVAVSGDGDALMLMRRGSCAEVWRLN
jgi:hypothetical protein